jgi:hypothetical protein
MGADNKFSADAALNAQTRRSAGDHPLKAENLLQFNGLAVGLKIGTKIGKMVVIFVCFCYSFNSF